MKELADFLLQYGWVGLSVILMFVCVFLYFRAEKKEKKIYELYERNEANSLKYADGMEKMRQTVERLLLQGGRGTGAP